ncbi:gliding motility-associated C-terminal domain-containing protein [Croceitalea sp. MTPC5]|uniref:gliding motility-associated C-terminal domain-containing protein n=1 Tax=Croceitalea sp. MTPC5 TaxID=3056565 RepID=UPI0030D1848D
MKNILISILLLVSPLIWGQTAFYNSGGLQLHSNTQIGFHTNFINDSEFTTTDGLIGFYGDNPITLQGIIAPTIYDAEIFLPNNLLLENQLNVTNNFNFIGGNVESLLSNETVYLNFEENAFFTGENDTSKVTGFAAITDKRFFSFPVGDETLLRPLLLESDNTNDFALCAYLFENPSNPTSIPERFDTDNIVRDIGFVSDQEFWIIQANQPSVVTVSWNPRSALDNLATSVEEIILVGWSKSSDRWIAIGNSAISGDLNQGFLVSEKFVPSDYAAITFGTTPLPTDTFAVNNPTLGNYFLSPNGDGTNDFLVFDEIEDVGANQVFIYNRFGQKVFAMANYVNEFGGVSNIDNLVLSRDDGLPEGIYFYTVTLFDEGLDYQGFLFLDR